MSRPAAASAVLIFISLAHTLQPAFAEEPTVESVLKKIPVLSPDNLELKNFTATVRCDASVPGAAMLADIAWVRDKGCSEVMYNPSSGAPIGYLADEKLMFYDLIAGTVIVLENANAAIDGHGTDDGVSFGIGFDTSKQKVCLDLPSFFEKLDVCLDEATLDQTDGKWQLTRQGDEVQMVGIVSPDQQWPLHEFRLGSADGKHVAFSVSNIYINQADVAVRKFPSAEQFPAELKVDRITKENSKGFFASLGVSAKWGKFVYAHAALANPELRDIPFGGFVDWEKAAEAEKTIGPAFRKLLAFEEKPMTVNASDAGNAK